VGLNDIVAVSPYLAYAVGELSVTSMILKITRA